MTADVAPGAPERRLAAIDVFRGLTIVGMLLVNNPGDPSTTYGQLRHSVWNGCTLADLVFPFFLFVVGITTHLSLSRRLARGDDAAAIRRQILRRAALIFAFGLLLNWYPFIQSGAIAGHPAPNVIDRLLERLLHLRFLGVLQRIGLAYAAAALLSWRATGRRIVMTVSGLLIGYWIVMTVVPIPNEGVTGVLLGDPSRTLAAWLDRIALDWTRFGLGNHLWDTRNNLDPEGLLSTVPAIATTLLGVLAGRWLATEQPLSRRIAGLLRAGMVGVTAGLAWNVVFPINKSIWTSSYVLFTAGMACLILAAVTWFMSVPRWRGDRWTHPFLVFGTNPIVAYVGSELLANILHSSIKPILAGHRVPTELWFTSHHRRARRGPAGGFPRVLDGVRRPLVRDADAAASAGDVPARVGWGRRTAGRYAHVGGGRLALRRAFSRSGQRPTPRVRS